MVVESEWFDSDLEQLTEHDVIHLLNVNLRHPLVSSVLNAIMIIMSAELSENSIIKELSSVSFISNLRKSCFELVAVAKHNIIQKYTRMKEFTSQNIIKIDKTSGILCSIVHKYEFKCMVALRKPTYQEYYQNLINQSKISQYLQKLDEINAKMQKN